LLSSRFFDRVDGGRRACVVREVLSSCRVASRVASRGLPVLRSIRRGTGTIPAAATSPEARTSISRDPMSHAAPVVSRGQLCRAIDPSPTAPYGENGAWYAGPPIGAMALTSATAPATTAPRAHRARAIRACSQCGGAVRLAPSFRNQHVSSADARHPRASDANRSSPRSDRLETSRGRGAVSTSWMIIIHGVGD